MPSRSRATVPAPAAAGRPSRLTLRVVVAGVVDGGQVVASERGPARHVTGPAVASARAERAAILEPARRVEGRDVFHPPGPRLALVRDSGHDRQLAPAGPGVFARVLGGRVLLLVRLALPVAATARAAVHQVADAAAVLEPVA